MVRNYKRKTKRGEWSKLAMKNAMDAVLSNKIGYKKAAKEYSVPRTTLERYVKKIKNACQVEIGQPLGPYKTVFSRAEEEELVSYLKDMEQRLFGLTSLDLRQIAYKLAVKNKKKHNFNTTKQVAGKDWLMGFLKRNPTLSIRKPEATSAARAMGFNKVAVSKFYDLLGTIYDKYKLTSDRIYNCDETGISNVSKTKSKIIAEKGRKQVGSISSAERGQTVTVEICFNAAGTYMPPLMVFPRQRMKAELLDHAPPGTTAECNSRGWMTTETFIIWFKRFVQFSGASLANPVLLLLDGHVTHTKNLELIELARENGVVLLCFPPHCTHKLQLDVSFMKPLSVYYDRAATAWLRSHPGRVITMFQISEIFGQAYIQAATMSTAINGFKKCGIWPFNENNFNDADFIASQTTNIPLPEKQLNNPDHQDEPNISEQLEQQPCCFRSLENCITPTKTPPSAERVCRDLTSTFENISPAQILSIPVTQQTKKRKCYRRGKTAILTSTPYKNELEDLKSKEKKKCSNENDPRLKNKKNKTVGKKAEPQTTVVDDCECLYCGHTYLESSEGWVACQLCARWSHNSCAGVDENNTEEVHICGFCEQY